MLIKAGNIHNWGKEGRKKEKDKKFSGWRNGGREILRKIRKYLQRFAFKKQKKHGNYTSIPKINGEKMERCLNEGDYKIRKYEHKINT